MRRLAFLDSLGAAPRTLLVALDVTALVLGALALIGARYAGLEAPEVVLHGVWICLTVQAFLFGLRVTVVRIVAASLFLVAYALVVDPRGVGTVLEIQELAVSDWPLMVVVSIIVALMAERVIGTGRRYAAMYRQASDQLLTAHESERRSLALDLHDSVGQALTGLILVLDTTERILWAEEPDRPEAGRDALHRAQDLAVGALTDSRELANRLRPARLEEAGLGGAIAELAVRAGHPVELRVDPNASQPGMFHIDQEIEVFRIIQEAVGNATRHAAATRIWVTLERRPRGLYVEVGDDGRGFRPPAASQAGLGLAGMRERANVLHADLRVRSSPGHGARIELLVPWAIAATRRAGDDARVPGAAS